MPAIYNPQEYFCTADIGYRGRAESFTISGTTICNIARSFVEGSLEVWIGLVFLCGGESVLPYPVH